MKTVVYSCPFVPAEWIAAHGLRPSRILPSADDRPHAGGPIEGLCPWAHAFKTAASGARSADAVIATTLCDQMRRAAEWIARDVNRPVFLLNVPATWETPAAHRYYVDELRRLGHFLVGLGGKRPSPGHLAETMRRFDDGRSALRGARGRLAPRAWSEALAEFHRRGKPAFEAAGDGRAALPTGVPLALLGGPLRQQDFAVFDLIEQAGGYVALDATETGERTLPAPLDRRRLRDDPLLELAEAYFGAIPDASRRPNHMLYQWLARETETRGVRGIIVRRYLWCDPWHAEVQRLRDWGRPPVLDVDVEDHDPDSAAGRLLTRLTAFVELLT